jgi:hypothetical protein
MTFSLEHVLKAIPAYRHEILEQVFGPLLSLPAMSAVTFTSQLIKSLPPDSSNSRITDIEYIDT